MVSSDAHTMGLNVGARDVVNTRLALMALLPNIAGLVFAFGLGLAGFTNHRYARCG
jgi:hypothetical protein